MANPTTNFGWVMPTSTSLVTNLPADFNTFGQGVDTSMAQLKGGTTGQVLSKTSGTDMAFTWVTPTDQTPLTTKGDLFAFSTVDARLAVGANETRLVADSTQTVGLKYVADTTNYAINAKGDLLAGTAADTLQAISVGTNGQTLVADSSTATGLKWATPASGSTFVGVSVYGGTLSVANNTSTAVPFTGENFDTSTFHDNTTNNTRITIPTGKGGYYQVNLASGTFDPAAAGVFYFQIKKNGTDIMETPSAKLFTGAYAGQGYSYIFSLAAGDYIQLYANQSSGGTLNLYSNQANSNFSFSYLGA